MISHQALKKYIYKVAKTTFSCKILGECVNLNVFSGEEGEGKYFKQNSNFKQSLWAQVNKKRTFRLIDRIGN